MRANIFQLAQILHHSEDQKNWQYDHFQSHSYGVADMHWSSISSFVSLQPRSSIRRSLPLLGRYKRCCWESWRTASGTGPLWVVALLWNLTKALWRLCEVGPNHCRRLGWGGSSQSGSIENSQINLIKTPTLRFSLPSPTSFLNVYTIQSEGHHRSGSKYSILSWSHRIWL